ncbi:hypothetical protein O3Q52_27945 [Streptomyces sp. ActVer]|uniref:hypothetical protein n=1 Tax=Streptomyces sp. ActVer TaxID=3014558 RepID=UPI0022B3E04E|nr:hypothetical protein [Streptomyces sp. ActVer]MCZ4511943.1 hypothetical protein [Streptomyces sp. ActVer]
MHPLDAVGTTHRVDHRVQAVTHHAVDPLHTRLAQNVHHLLGHGQIPHRRTSPLGLHTCPT